MRTTGWLRSLVPSTTAAAAHAWQLWREKHDMPKVSSLLIGDPLGSTNVHARRGHRE